MISGHMVDLDVHQVPPLDRARKHLALVGALGASGSRREPFWQRSESLTTLQCRPPHNSLILLRAPEDTLCDGHVNDLRDMHVSIRWT